MKEFHPQPDSQCDRAVREEIITFLMQHQNFSLQSIIKEQILKKCEKHTRVKYKMLYLRNCSGHAMPCTDQIQTVAIHIVP